MQRLDRLRVVRPLRVRDFRLLWIGTAVSLLGDGVFAVALPWQVYDLSRSPTALSLVGVAWAVPLGALVLVGGVMSDRVERRKLMIAADTARIAAIATLGVLSVTGDLTLWHILALVAVYGAGEALYGPAFGAIVPDIVPEELLLEANSLDQLVQPIAMRLAGPAFGGVIVATAGPGGAFLIDAASFAASAIALLCMEPPSMPARGRASARAVLGDLGEALRFVRMRPWLWGTLVVSVVQTLAYAGPLMVLVPLIVKNSLDGSASDLGLVYATGGVGAMLFALAGSQFGLPRRHVLFMFLVWTFGVLAIGGYGLATALWQMALVSFVCNGLFALGQVAWATLTQKRVPRQMLGRIHSFAWLVMTTAAPLSYALVGPVAVTVGAQSTLVGSAVLGAASTVLILFTMKLRPGGIEPTQKSASRAASSGD